MTKPLFKFSVGPVEFHLYKPDDVYTWRPARWWSPQVTHLRPVPGVVINIPRRWWSSPQDRYCVCGFCGQRRWLEGGGGNGACEECRRTLRCVQVNVKGPPWWPERLARVYREATGEEWTD